MRQGYEGWELARKQLRPQERAERDEEAWRLWVAGRSSRSIAAQFGVSTRVIDRVLMLRRKAVEEDAPSVGDFRTMIVEGTRDVIATMVEVMHSDPAPAYSNGRPVLREDGSQALDHSVQLAAADRVLKAYERLGKVTGVEAPDINQVTIQVQAQSDAEVAARAALERLMAAANMPALPAGAVATGTAVDEVPTEDVHVD